LPHCSANEQPGDGPDDSPLTGEGALLDLITRPTQPEPGPGYMDLAPKVVGDRSIFAINKFD